MIEYKDFAPTGFDPTGLNGGENGINDWLVLPISQNRDSDILIQCNFIAALDMLGGEDNEELQVHRFGHWACGWFEIIVIKPITNTHLTAIRLIQDYENYPVLDEDLYYTERYEYATEYWQSLSLSDRIDLCNEYEVSILAARHERIPYEDTGGLEEYLSQD